MNNKITFTFNTSPTPVQVQAPTSSQKPPLSQPPPPSSQPFGLSTNPPSINNPVVLNQPLPSQFQQAPYAQSIGQQNISSSSYGLAQNVPSSSPFYSPPQIYTNNIQVNKPSSVSSPFVKQVPPVSSTYPNWPPLQQPTVSYNSYAQQPLQFGNYAPIPFEYSIGVNRDPI